MSFSIFHRPGAVVFLDDDPAYLEMLGMALPAHWHIELFLRPQPCINYLQQEPPQWEEDAWQQQRLVDRWRAGSPLIPQILAYWAEAPLRHALTQVCVFDYSMPGMDGLQALGELVDWPGARVLLTGQADEHVAVTAFNRSAIDQFIPKQTPNISRRLIDSVQQLLDRAHPRHEQIWRNTLSADQCALLRIPSVGLDLSEFAKKHWVEHVVIGEPFGVLGLDANGHASWLQLEPAGGLADMAELAEAEAMPQNAVQEIRTGRSLVDLELRQSLEQTHPPRLRPAFDLGLDGALKAALFELPGLNSPAAVQSYKDWLSSHSGRAVRD